MVVLAGTSAGCRDEDLPAVEEQRPNGRVDFGDPYQIVTNKHPALPDEPPSLASDTLTLQVSYTGGCEDHMFDLEYASESDTTKLWIRHRNGDDSCEEDVYEWLEFTLPREAVGNSTVVLLNPDDDVPFIVRWGRQRYNSRDATPPLPAWDTSRADAEL